MVLNGTSRRRFVRTVGVGASGLLAGCLGRAHLDSGDDPDDEDDLDVDLAFADVAKEAGFEYQYAMGDGPNKKELVTNAGVYVSDVTANGYPDVLALGGDEPVLFENDGGTFEESDALPAIDTSMEFNAALFFDHDNDGWEDLLLIAVDGPPTFLENEGGSFVERSVGFDDVEWTADGEPIGAAAADSVGDGFPDVFVVQNGNWTDTRPLQLTEGRVPETDNGAPNYLFRGDGTAFEPATDVGITGTRWSLAVSFVDITGNGAPDIHVANDFNFDIFYENDGDGTFERREIPNSNRNAMSSTVADVTGDQRREIFVTNIYYPAKIEEADPWLPRNLDGNNLFVYEDGEFVNRSREYDVWRGGWGWATVIADFANDGLPSIVHTNMPYQTRSRQEEVLEMSIDRIEEVYPYLQYPTVYRQTADGTFELEGSNELGMTWSDGRGLAELDYDGDGSLDLAMGNARERGNLDDWRGKYRLYENRSDGGNWIQIDVRSDGEHTAIGAEVTVETDERVHSKVTHSRTHFLSQSWRTLHFGVGTSERVDVEVHWPDGTAQRFSDVDADRRIAVHPNGTTEPVYGE